MAQGEQLLELGMVIREVVIIGKKAVHHRNTDSKWRHFIDRVESCPQEAIVTQIMKSLVTNLQHTVTLTLEHHTVIASAVRKETS